MHTKTGRGVNMASKSRWYDVGIIISWSSTYLPSSIFDNILEVARLIGCQLGLCLLYILLFNQAVDCSDNIRQHAVARHANAVALCRTGLTAVVSVQVPYIRLHADIRHAITVASWRLASRHLSACNSLEKCIHASSAKRL